MGLALVAADGAQAAERFIDFLPPTSATVTPAKPMPARSTSLCAGARRTGCVHSARSNRCRENRQDIFDLWQAFTHELGDPRVAFWTKLTGRIRDGLASKGSERWNVTLNSEDPEKLSRRNAGRVFVSSKGSDAEHLCCQFLVQEYAGRLEYGIVWTEELTPKREQEILAATKELVSLRGDLGKQDFKRHSWWVAVKRVMDLDLDETRVVADLYSGDRVQRLLADKVLDLFDQAAGRVKKINDTLAKENL